MSILAEQMKICGIHADRLELGMRKIQHLYTFSPDSVRNITDEDIGYLDLFTTRLGRLQDTLGEKVFPVLLEAMGETTEHVGFLDRLNKLEKLEIIPSSSWWQELRKLRNILVQEYPDDPEFIANNLNTAFVQARRFLAFWESLLEMSKSKVWI